MQAFFGLENNPATRGALHAAVHGFFLNLPHWVLIPVMTALCLSMVLLLRQVLRDRRCRITAMSVKEAMDNLPVALCCWLPGGRIVLANTAMETLCQAAAGEILYSGVRLYQLLTQEPPAHGCRLAEAGDAKILLLPDGAARALSLQTLTWAGSKLCVLLATDVTEAWGKNLPFSTVRRRRQACGRIRGAAEHDPAARRLHLDPG